MRHLALIGTAVSLVLIAAMVRGPVEASIGGRYIAYEITLSHGGLIVAAYVAATCGALLASTTGSSFGSACSISSPSVSSSG